MNISSITEKQEVSEERVLKDSKNTKDKNLGTGLLFSV